MRTGRRTNRRTGWRTNRRNRSDKKSPVAAEPKAAAAPPAPAAPSAATAAPGATAPVGSSNASAEAAPPSQETAPPPVAPANGDQNGAAPATAAQAAAALGRVGRHACTRRFNRALERLARRGGFDRSSRAAGGRRASRNASYNILLNISRNTADKSYDTFRRGADRAQGQSENDRRSANCRRGCRSGRSRRTERNRRSGRGQDVCAARVGNRCAGGCGWRIGRRQPEAMGTFGDRIASAAPGAVL